MRVLLGTLLHGVVEEHLSLTLLIYLHDDTYIEENQDSSAMLLHKGIQLMVKG